MVAGPLAVLGRAVAVVAQVEAHLVVGVVEAGRPRGLVLVGLGREGWKESETGVRTCLFGREGFVMPSLRRGKTGGSPRSSE